MPDTSKPIEKNEFVGVYTSSIKVDTNMPAIRILYGAEIDAISPTTDEFIEIKV